MIRAASHLKVRFIQQSPLDFEKDGMSEDVIEQNTGCIKKINRLKRDAMREFHNIHRFDKNSRIAIVPFDTGVLYKEKCYMPLMGFVE
ncbi:hypothetical protein [Candidatus Sodalis pierantonius]|uniref:hypothetical protein n=1 Tax=Candidatus Sodalis pierantonii TaxID=1486991 RepID=UPI00130EB1DF|nr:hypothetical protein [Candidatus Sodalis pierantonius]